MAEVQEVVQLGIKPCNKEDVHSLMSFLSQSHLIHLDFETFLTHTHTRLGKTWDGCNFFLPFCLNLGVATFKPVCSKCDSH